MTPPNTARPVPDTNVLPRRPALLDRARELAQVCGAINRLQEGSGSCLLVEARAGLGKTALLDEAALLATEAGCVVRRAAPGPLERHFPSGVLRALFEATSAGAEAIHRVDGVLVLCSELAARGPVVLIVDDAQWADPASLDVLASLVGRMPALPVLLLVAGREADPAAASDLLAELASAAATMHTRLMPLSARGSASVIRRIAPDASGRTCLSCHVEAGGDPWLLERLGHRLKLRHDGTASTDVEARTAVRRRVASLLPHDRTVVAALAVLGADPSHPALPAIARVTRDEAAVSCDALVAAGLLTPGTHRFPHPLIRSAVLHGLARSEQERLHRESARERARCGEAPRLIADHLLHCPPGADPDVSAALLLAGRAASACGSPRAAAEYTRRAIEERAAGDDRVGLLSQLATTTFEGGLPDAGPRLREALHEARDRHNRLGLLRRLVSVPEQPSDALVAVELLERELGTTPGSGGAEEQAAVLDALLVLPDGRMEHRRRGADAEHGTDPTSGRRLAAHRAWLAIERGGTDARTCAGVALGASGDGLLLAHPEGGTAFELCVRALLATGQEDAARKTIEAMRSRAIELGSLRLRAGAEACAAELALRHGRLDEAVDEASLVLASVGGIMNACTALAMQTLVCALAETGQVARAQELLRTHELAGTLDDRSWATEMLHARAKLHLAGGSFEAAAADGLRCGKLLEARGHGSSGLHPWRSTVALALAHLGQFDEAAGLADAELALARAFGAPLAIATAMHARIVAEPGPATRLTMCDQALHGTTHGLHGARVHIERGSTLSRLGRRIVGRAALQRGLNEAEAVGAMPLVMRARRELVATGLRTRRTEAGGDGVLTPRQRQVCDLAARGATNREIAQQLFLSAKTVETHLAASYRKLGVGGRTALARHLPATG